MVCAVRPTNRRREDLASIVFDPFVRVVVSSLVHGAFPEPGTNGVCGAQAHDLHCNNCGPTPPSSGPLHLLPEPACGETEVGGGRGLRKALGEKLAKLCTSDS